MIVARPAPGARLARILRITAALTTTPMMRLDTVLGLALALAAPYALACTQDLECGPQARCVKANGETLGICVAAPLRDRAPNEPQQYVGLPDDRPQSRSSCLFDADCPRDGACVKTSANAPGLCVRRR